MCSSESICAALKKIFVQLKKIPTFSMTETKVIEGVNEVHTKSPNNKCSIYFLLANFTNIVNVDDFIYIQLLKRICTIVNGKSNFKI